MIQAQQEQWKDAYAKVERIKNTADRQIRYRDVRPIVTIRQMFDSSVEEFGERTAFYIKEIPGGPYRPITYKETKKDVDGLGTELLHLGLSGKRIAIVGPSRYEWAVSYLAVTGGVGVAVPLDKELPGNELLQLIVESDAEAVIFSSKYKEIFQEALGSEGCPLKVLICMDELGQEILSFRRVVEAGRARIASGDRSFDEAGEEIDPQAMGILLFTSGTTGIAKGVMLSHENICEDLMSMVSLVSIRKEDIFFSVLPIHHTYECTCGFLCPLYRGAAIAYCEGLRYIVKNLSEVRPTVLLAVPMLFENFYKKIWGQAKKSGLDQKMRTVLKINRLTKKVGLDLVPRLLSRVTDIFGGRMRLMICGGAAIDPAVIEGIQEFGITALQGYGLTECGPIAALNPDVDGKPSAAGRSIPDVALRIDEPDAEGIGEICVRGKNVMLGYYRNEEATAEVLRDGWFHTGDLGRMDSDGFVHITGRRKNVIITKNGKNVFPEEIEYYLGKIPYVEECMVYGKDPAGPGGAGDLGGQSELSQSGQSGDVLIFAVIKPDEEAITEALGPEASAHQIETLLWQEIDKINEGLPFFKRIKKLSVRKEAFEKTTAQKIKRFSDANKE